MNGHALQVLQFPEAVELVARHASSPLGAAAVRALEPSDALAWVETELRRVDQMVGFLLRAEEFALPTIPDLRLSLRRLAVEGSVWEGTELRDGAVLMDSSRTTRRALLQHAQDYPLLAQLAERLVKLEGEEESIRRAVDDAGLVRDDASRELARLRKEIRALRTSIVERLEQFMATLPDRVRVADASVSVREGRYVIPIRREGRGDVGGIVHDESATGNTLFIEPPLAIELMNRLRGLEAAEAREVQRILRELTERLRPHREALEAALEALVALDALYARAKYALEWNGRRPEMLPAGSEEYDVVQAYHPLLLAGLDPVVPFDLRLDPGERTLLVSGPNTGGKTVLLKAIGLMSALAQAGVIPPVGAGTRLPLFRDIFADIGDEQSIEASLSTFSAHVKNLREILNEAGHASLVLIDEVGSGTDPAEGGALAQAILIELTRRATLTVATSHLGQLKLLAGEQPGVVNASLQFDARELRPTFRLVKGVPGRSYGLAIARRLGFPGEILARAESLLPQAERDVRELLRELEEKEQRLAEALTQAEAAWSEALSLRRLLEEREHVVRKREREAEREAQRRTRELLLQAREEVEATIRDLCEAVARAEDATALEMAAREARRRIEDAARAAAERISATEPMPAAAAARAGPIAPGVHVRVAATGATGTVIELRDDRATVETGGIRLQVPVAGLVVLSPEEVEATASSSTARVDGAAPPPSALLRDVQVRGGAGWTGPELEASPEVDLRGRRAEEIAGELEPALDAAIHADLPNLRIIHGKGTGVLRQVVAELLRADPRVKRFRPGGPGEGGAGVTIAELQ
ncbi:MAG: endonuclease MutS2 [Gemmatimonadetes bacterium]|nr:endonuclease MutS2 [Gemmatimonadota bacterium]